jgi:hypothetical protein
MKKDTIKNVKLTHDILMTEIIINQALIDILIAKQVITEEELMKSIQEVKKNQLNSLAFPSTILVKSLYFGAYSSKTILRINEP